MKKTVSYLMKGENESAKHGRNLSRIFQYGL